MRTWRCTGPSNAVAGGSRSSTRRYGRRSCGGSTSAIVSGMRFETTWSCPTTNRSSAWTTGRSWPSRRCACWRDADLGVIPPTEFIAIAEEHGLIVDLGSSILRQACLAAARWSFSGQAPIGLAVNLSARQLTDPSLVSLVGTVLAESKLNPTRLSLEVTESVLMDDVNANLEVLLQLRDLGIHLAIDDFGTGYSSLAYLRRLPVDTLKIDRSFILGIGSPEDNAIVTAIVGLAHTLGRRVIAEGVEDSRAASVPTGHRMRDGARFPARTSRRSVPPDAPCRPACQSGRTGGHRPLLVMSGRATSTRRERHGGPLASRRPFARPG